MVPPAESEHRIRRLQARLRAEGIDGALLIYPVDIYYYAGTRQNGVLWIPAAGEPILLARKSFTRACAETLIPDTRPFPPSREFPNLFGSALKKIGLTFDVLPVQYYQYYAGLLPGREFVDISTLNRELRSVKSPWEQERLRESGQRLATIFWQIPSFLDPSMREIDLAAEIDFRLRRAGSVTKSLMRSFGQVLISGIAVAGAAAAAPGCMDGPVTGKGVRYSSPVGSSGELIAQNTPILVDYAGIFSGYVVDMTRMFVFGDLAPVLKNAFAVSCDIQTWLVENLKPGQDCEELYIGALKIAEGAGLADNFMGHPGEQSRFVGHGVGLELDELPLIAKGFNAPLQDGQALAIEPKFVFPGQGVVGIENTWLVTPSGGEKLTALADDLMYL